MPRVDLYTAVPLSATNPVPRAARKIPPAAEPSTLGGLIPPEKPRYGSVQTRRVATATPITGLTRPRPKPVGTATHIVLPPSLILLGRALVARPLPLRARVGQPPQMARFYGVGGTTVTAR